METLTATKARSNLFTLIKKAVSGHRQYRVRSKEGGVILISEEDYESLLETLELLSTPGLLKSVRKAKQQIKKGQTSSLESIFRE
jgi:antitoxin YefM